jgi:hypothetical protein
MMQELGCQDGGREQLEVILVNGEDGRGRRERHLIEMPLIHSLTVQWECTPEQFFSLRDTSGAAPCFALPTPSFSEKLVTSIHGKC